MRQNHLGYIAANIGKLALDVATTGYKVLPEKTQITALVENIYDQYICNDDYNTNTDHSTHTIFNDECNKLALLAGDFALINKDGSVSFFE